MMSEKARLFGDESIIEKIASSRTPGEAKKLELSIKGFRDETWNKHKFEIVVNGNVAKFEQNPELRIKIRGQSTSRFYRIHVFDWI